MEHQQRANFELKRFKGTPMIQFVEIPNYRTFKASANYELELLKDHQQRSNLEL